VVALGSLAAGAAHELGTPLATIAVLIGELVEDRAVSRATKNDLALMREQVEHCKNIITGLAERGGQIRAEGGSAVYVDHWLEQIVARWRRLRPRAEVSLDVSSKLPVPRIVGETTLEQALLNLFNNAADACPEGIEIEARWDATALVIEVRDQGPGIDENVLRAPARAFVTTRPEGTGIGLFLAHAVIERFGGKIRLSNRENGGAATRVELPLDRLIAEAP
jgi:two-component system sensor histidine kinase RegB